MVYQPLPAAHRDRNRFLNEFHIAVDISVLRDIIHWAIQPRESLLQEIFNSLPHRKWQTTKNNRPKKKNKPTIIKKLYFPTFHGGCYKLLIFFRPQRCNHNQTCWVNVRVYPLFIIYTFFLYIDVTQLSDKIPMVQIHRNKKSNIGSKKM